MTLTANRCFWGCFLMLKGFNKVDARLDVGVGDAALSRHLGELLEMPVTERHCKLTELIGVDTWCLRTWRGPEILLIWHWCHLWEWIIVSHRTFLRYLV